MLHASIPIVKKPTTPSIPVILNPGAKFPLNEFLQSRVRPTILHHHHPHGHRLAQSAVDGLLHVITPVKNRYCDRDLVSRNVHMERDATEFVTTLPYRGGR